MFQTKHRYCTPHSQYRFSQSAVYKKLIKLRTLEFYRAYDSHLTFKDHIQEKNNKAYSMIGLIKRNFIHMDSRPFVMLYKALVRPHVE